MAAQNQYASLIEAAEAHGIDGRWMQLILKAEQKGFDVESFLKHWLAQENENIELKKELARRDAREAYSKRGIPGPGRPRRDDVQRVRTVDEKELAQESVDDAISSLLDGMRITKVVGDELSKAEGNTVEDHIRLQARKAFAGRTTLGRESE